MHTDPQWDDAIDGLTQQNPDLERDDLVLMSTYISGRVTHMAEDSASDSPSQSSPSPTSEELSGALQQALDLLRTLSPDAPEWEQGVAEFVQSIEEIREKKQADAEAIATLDAEVMSMAQLHEDLLAFFEWSAEEKLKERAYPWADMDAAQAMIDKLSGLLKSMHKCIPWPRCAARNSNEDRAGLSCSSGSMRHWPSSGTWRSRHLHLHQWSRQSITCRTLRPPNSHHNL
jgi:hypothetical protein